MKRVIIGAVALMLTLAACGVGHNERIVPRGGSYTIRCSG